jgi:hypothetical protein
MKLDTTNPDKIFEACEKVPRSFQKTVSARKIENKNQKNLKNSQKIYKLDKNI